MNYYNEFDPKAAAWLRELIASGLIPSGDVDMRSIAEVTPNDLAKYTQCHFFAGIGGWSRALELAGWPATRPVWTGSCPCQPFSAAGKQLGTADSRHLWPQFARLIGECHPAAIFGEQVAGKTALEWLDGVFADLERSSYACGASDLPAAGVGSPHIRQRIFWVAYSMRQRGCRGKPAREDAMDAYPRSEKQRLDWGGLWQAIEPEPCPLANGFPGRLAILRGYGNAIVPPLAAEFIQACEEAAVNLTHG